MSRSVKDAVGGHRGSGFEFGSGFGACVLDSPAKRRFGKKWTVREARRERRRIVDRALREHEEDLALDAAELDADIRESLGYYDDYDWFEDELKREEDYFEAEEDYYREELYRYVLDEEDRWFWE